MPLKRIGLGGRSYKALKAVAKTLDCIFRAKGKSLEGFKQRIGAI